MLTAVGSTSVTVRVNGSFSFEANITGHNLPISSVLWTRNGDELMNNDQLTVESDITTLNSGSTRLSVNYTLSLVDNGTYTVTVFNPAGNDTLDYYVTIESKTLTIIM